MSKPYLHFSDRPLTTIHSRPQFNTPDDKPNGLWFSVGNAWPEFAHRYLTQHSLQHATRLWFKPKSLLRIHTEADMKKFTRKYSVKREDASIAAILRLIQWDRVAEDYKGILIANYIYQCRMSHPWYYSWDVASGCVWDASAVSKFAPYEGEECVGYRWVA